MLISRAAQSLNEYAIIIAIITVSIMGINTYLKRGIQNAIKSTADDLGSPAQDIYKIHSQTLGVMEPGMVDYWGQTWANAQKENNLVEVQQSAPNPMRTATTVKDESINMGAWVATDKLGAADGFSAKDNIKKINSALNNAGNSP
jgi:hypothetical protein